MPPDRFQGAATGLSVPFTYVFDITPNDDEDLPEVTRAIWVGTGGDLAFLNARDRSAGTLPNIQDGTLIPGRFVRILAEGTGAQDIRGCV